MTSNKPSGSRDLIFARHWLLSHYSIYLEQSFGAATPRNYLCIALSPSSPSAAHMRVTSIRSVRSDQRFGSHSFRAYIETCLRCYLKVLDGLSPSAFRGSSQKRTWFL